MNSFEDGQINSPLPPPPDAPPHPSLIKSPSTSEHQRPITDNSPLTSCSPSPSAVLDAQVLKRKFTGCSRLDRYELLDKIGEGTFGEVYKARNKQTGEKVALKKILMDKEKAGIPITALREIKILKTLNHPNVVTLTDMAIKRGNRHQRQRSTIYMVFPYMEHDLTGLLDNPQVNFTIPQIKCYMKQLMEGMLYLHNNKILHRDVKGANLLINNKGILRITDFGLARTFDPSSEREYTNCVVTRWYRPPELLLGSRYYGAEVDMWGIGCVFAEMLLKRPLFPSTNELDHLSRIFKLCGSPTPETMPDLAKYPNGKSIANWPLEKRTIHEKFQQFDSVTIDLLDKLLVLDPKKRLTAFEALDHDYFWSQPLPAEPSSLPQYSFQSHEYDTRKAKQAAYEASKAAREAAAAHANNSAQRARGQNSTSNSSIGPRNVHPPEQSVNRYKPYDHPRSNADLNNNYRRHHISRK